MTNKEKAWELSKLLAKYADDEESYFEHNYNLTAIQWARTGGIPSMQSDLSKWRVSKPRKLDWMKVPINTLVNVQDGIGELPEERYFLAYLPSNIFNTQFFTFADGETQVNAKQLVPWKYCELHSSVKIQDEWYEDEIKRY